MICQSTRREEQQCHVWKWPVREVFSHVPKRSDHWGNADSLCSLEFFVFCPLGDIFSTVGLRAPPAMALPRLLAASWPRLRCVALLELVARAAAEVGVVLFIASPQLHTSFREVFVRVKLPIIKNGAKYLVEIHVRLLLPRIVNNAFNIRTQ